MIYKIAACAGCIQKKDKLIYTNQIINIKKNHKAVNVV